ncbi:MAG: SMI1/KNR4 family protein [Sedimentisphaerales bacterium]|nr:SMI1/KNR4 family protein [Sedimentisphaerales bacterium]
MSMNDYLSALELISETNEGDFEGSKPDTLIEAAEKTLNLKFPPTYKRFLKEFGCGDIYGEEFYGIINEEFVNSGVPNGIWLTLNERHNIGLSSELVIVHTSGDGTYHAIDTSKVGDSGENPIVLLSPNGEKIKDISEDFGKFFYETLRIALQ